MPLIFTRWCITSSSVAHVMHSQLCDGNYVERAFCTLLEPLCRRKKVQHLTTSVARYFSESPMITSIMPAGEAKTMHPMQVRNWEEIQCCCANSWGLLKYCSYPGRRLVEQFPFTCLHKNKNPAKSGPCSPASWISSWPSTCLRECRRQQETYILFYSLALSLLK